MRAARKVLVLLLLGGCKSETLLTERFVDSFDRADLGPNYRDTGGSYRIEQGRLVVKGAHNHPLWLAKRLPSDVQIELDCLSRSPEGDIKMEVFGDGRSAQSDSSVAQDLAYTASGYVLIFGGWKNHHSVLAKQEEHGHGAPSRQDLRVVPNRSYHFAITRRKGELSWSIDGQPFLKLADPNPLVGNGHDHFGFSGWETEVVFDNLVVTPL